MLFKTNKVQCLHCKDVLVSTDDVPVDKCSCGKNTIQGGSKFLIRSGKRGTDYKELSEADIEKLEGSENTEEIKDLLNWQRQLDQKRGK